MLHRKIDGPFHTLIKEFKEQDSYGFKGYVRMDVDHFEELIYLLGIFIEKQDPNIKECIN